MSKYNNIGELIKVIDSHSEKIFKKQDGVQVFRTAMAPHNDTVDWPGLLTRCVQCEVKSVFKDFLILFPLPPASLHPP